MLEVSSELREQIDFDKYLDEYEYNHSEHKQKVKHVSEFVKKALERLKGGGKIFGDAMPWKKTRDRIRFREKEVTVWAGVNGQGKSLVLNQVMLHISTFKKIAIASLEMPADSTVARMIRQSCCSSEPDKEKTERFCKELNIYIYDHIGSMKPKTVYGMCHYLAVEKGVKHIVIDSMVKCGVDSEKITPQKEFLNEIQQIAKTHDIHIHIVHHMRKGADETKMPDKFMVKGAGEIVDLTDNLIIVARNMKKVFDVKEGKIVDRFEPDGFLDVSKQRHFEWEGRFPFWWDEHSLQWLERCEMNPVDLFEEKDQRSNGGYHEQF